MVDEVRFILNERDLDCLLLTSRHNVGYASGFWGSFGAVFLTKHQNYLFTDFRYQEQARSNVKGFEIRIVSGTLYEELSELVKLEDLKSMGIEDGELTVREFNRLGTKTSDVKKYFISEDLTKVRMIKSPEEIEAVRRAEEISCRALSNLLDVLRPGMTEKAVAAELEYRLKQEGADGFAFDTIAVAGTHSSWVHGTPSAYPIQSGDFLLLDFGAAYENYCSDMTRTVAIGGVSERQKEVYETVLAAQQAGLNAIRAGVTGKQADAAARELITEAGFGDCFGHSLGHGVGVLIHECPTLSPKSDAVLEENMLVTVEPGIYLEGEFGVRIEDLVRVTPNGCENLTPFSTELITV